MGEPLHDPTVPAPEPAAAKPAGGIDMKLIGLCALLWVVALGIFASNYRDLKRDYYWGNISQGLASGLFDNDSIKALAEMGEDVLPSCEFELNNHWNPMFKCAVLRVVERVPGPKARALLASRLTGTTRDVDSRVRANAILSLRTRAKQWPEEKDALRKLVEGELGPQGEPELIARAVSALTAAELGNTQDSVKALVVFALRHPQFRRDAAAVLKTLDATLPPVEAEAREAELRKQIMAVETWLAEHGIAPVVSPLTAAVDSRAGGQR